MKRTAWLLLAIFFMSSCSHISTETSTSPFMPPPSTTTPQPPGSTITPVHPTTPTILDPTDVFITEVMATKYAARTEMAVIPTLTPTPPIQSSSPFCLPASLNTTFNTNGAGGHIVLEVGVTNISNTPCFLPSWPMIQLLDQSRKNIDIAYDFLIPNGSPSTLPPTDVTQPGEPVQYGLRPEQTASLLLAWGNWCQPAIDGGVIIRLFLSGTGNWIDIPTLIEGGGHCDDPGTKSTIDVIGFG